MGNEDLHEHSFMPAAIILAAAARFGDDDVASNDAAFTCLFAETQDTKKESTKGAWMDSRLHGRFAT